MQKYRAKPSNPNTCAHVDTEHVAEQRLWCKSCGSLGIVGGDVVWLKPHDLKKHNQQQPIFTAAQKKVIVAARKMGPDLRQQIKDVDRKLNHCLENIAAAEASGRNTDALMLQKTDLTHLKRALRSEIYQRGTRARQDMMRSIVQNEP